MVERVSEIRRRKLLAYRAYLGEPVSTALAGQVDGLDYLHALAEIVEIAPPHMALEIGSSRKLSELGVVGHLIQSAPDLRRTLRAWERHAQMAGELASMSNQITHTHWRVHFQPAPYLSASVARFVLEELVATFFAFAREVTGTSLAEFEAYLPGHRNPAVDYGAYLPGAVHFNSRDASARGPASALDRELIGRDDETFALLSAGLQSQPSATASADLRTALRETLLARPGHLPRLEDAARQLGMSGRTLARRLASDGVSFGEVLVEYRKSIALEMLQSGAASVAQVAQILGFRNEASFRRAFRSWFGQPVGRWRRASHG